MKIKEKYTMEVELEKEEIDIIDKAINVISDILYDMDDKGCDYLTYDNNNNENCGNYSVDDLEEIKENLYNIIGADSIYRDRSEE